MRVSTQSRMRPWCTRTLVLAMALALALALALAMALAMAPSMIRHAGCDEGP